MRRLLPLLAVLLPIICYAGGGYIFPGLIDVSLGGTGTATQFTSGSVVFAGAGGVYTQSNSNIYWDNTNNRLGIGTGAPTTALHISKPSGTKADTSLAQSGQNTYTWTIPASTTRLELSEVGGIRMVWTDNGNVGVGVVLPATKFHVSSGTLTIDGTSPKIVSAASTDPSLSACGTSPSITGSDISGKVTIGTGVTTSCTVTFAAAFANAPACVIAGNSTTITYAATTSATVLTITSSADMASGVISYICIGANP